MKKEIKFNAYEPDEFLDMKEIAEVKIINAWNYQKDYFILVIGKKKYMFKRDEFEIAIRDATNF
jgi:hypothetical protein